MATKKKAAAKPKNKPGTTNPAPGVKPITDTQRISDQQHDWESEQRKIDRIKNDPSLQNY